MRILVFGAGAMGSFFGGLLADRHDVVLVGRARHVEAVRSKGLRITGKTVKVARPEARTRISRGGVPDLVIVATKAYDTEQAMVHLRPFGGRATFVTLQNGLDNGDIIARTARRVVAGTTSHGVTFVGPGEIRHAGIGDTVLGPWANVDATDLLRIRDVFDDAGIPTKVSSDIRTELWAKVVVNAAINPIAALAGVPNGRLARDRRLAALVEAACREATAVARAEGASLDAADLVHRTALVARRTAANRCSMLQDLDLGRRTEIDAITGSIVRLGRARGLPVPLHEALLALVSAREGAQPREE